MEADVISVDSACLFAPFDNTSELVLIRFVADTTDSETFWIFLIIPLKLYMKLFIPRAMSLIVETSISFLKSPFSISLRVLIIFVSGCRTFIIIKENMIAVTNPIDATNIFDWDRMFANGVI